ncbi:hypothetical protein CCMA1212_001970 [Trichoderma ghanense]|uniref:Biogenesis of lysosome-related organelles complex 1 subunit 1 n=1 Tax=Trichoderma ghanense TaxID=65468 RepID=A0ABY2HD69_9HYPO
MSASSSTGPPKAPQTTTSTTTPNPSSSSSSPSSPSSSSSPSSTSAPSPRWLTHSHSQPSSVTTSPAAATASPPISPTLPTPSASRHVSDARAAVVASMGNMLDAELQSRAGILHANAAALEKQERDVVRATDSLRKETQKLKTEADKAARKVKELGNVQNWAEVLERGFLVLEETVRLANGGGETTDEDGEGSECSCSCSECGGEEEEDDDGSDGEDEEEERLGGEGDGDGDGGSKGNGKGVRSFENDAVRRLRTMDLNSMSDASRSLMSILEASSSTGRAKSSGATVSTG